MPDVAVAQLEREKAGSQGTTQAQNQTTVEDTGSLAPSGLSQEKSGVPVSSSPRKKSFYGRLLSDSSTLTRDAGAIAQNITAHLASLPESEIEVVIEIKASVPGGIDESTVRTVSENCRTLKFDHHEFED